MTWEDRKGWCAGGKWNKEEGMAKIVCDLNKVVKDDEKKKSPDGDRQQGWVAKLSALQTSGHELGY